MKLIDRLIFVSDVIRSTLRGQIILIEDRGDSCKTLISSKISKERFRVLLLNHLGLTNK